MSYRVIEKLLTCPFDPVHQILPHRMAAHIVKCWKNYPDADVKPCPFNATHIIKIPLMQAHVLECPDHGVVERDVYHILKSLFAGQKLQEQKREERLQSQGAHALPPPPCSEDWDSELVESTYNPADHTIYMEATRPPPPGMGKAARRQWRENEVNRVRDLKAGKFPDGAGVQAYGTSGAKESNEGRGASSVENVMRCSAQELRRPRIAANFGVQIESSDKTSSKTYEKPLDENGKLDRKAIIKEKRFYEKHLHGIQKLEMKVEEGHQLTAEERIKVGRKKQFEQELADLLRGINLNEL